MTDGDEELETIAVPPETKQELEEVAESLSVDVPHVLDSLLMDGGRDISSQKAKVHGTLIKYLTHVVDDTDCSDDPCHYLRDALDVEQPAE